MALNVRSTFMPLRTGAAVRRSGFHIRLGGRDMTMNLVTPLGPAYLRLQASRCQRLSRSSMDLGTARDLRLMSEEYFTEASKLEAGCLGTATRAAPKLQS